MSCTIAVGLQWGDEGKGKVVDLIADRFSHVVRCQGGHNAGHTILFDNQEFRLHLIPSGILHPGCRCYLAAGVAINPEHLLNEIAHLEKLGVQVKGRLFISGRAKVISPSHEQEDKDDPELGKIGTTKRGIGPSYRDFVARKGKLFAQIARGDSRLQPFLAPVEEILQEAAFRKEAILLEGAQGTLLDIAFGTYPFVTSSMTYSSGMLAGAGLSPRAVSSIIGISKAYTTRVGNGPFPTELRGDELAAFGDLQAIREIGTTTGRRRRIGWFDAVLGRYSARLNGVSEVALMKLDVLDPLDQIKICTAYELDGYRITTPPLDFEALDRVKPIYETLAGWKSSTRGIRTYEDLPSAAQHYVQRISTLLSSPFNLISVGPGREETIKVSL